MDELVFEHGAAAHFPVPDQRQIEAAALARANGFSSPKEYLSWLLLGASGLRMPATKVLMKGRTALGSSVAVPVIEVKPVPLPDAVMLTLADKAKAGGDVTAVVHPDGTVTYAVAPTASALSEEARGVLAQQKASAIADTRKRKGPRA